MFEENTYEKILERMLERVPSKFDKREGSVIYDAHSPAALELTYLYIELERILKESYGDTASREFLILRCRERGITPYPASKAVLKGEFAPADLELSGKRFNIDSVNYVVTERIAEGEYRVECETAGTVGNRHTGELIPIDYIDGLQDARLTEILIPGEDEEDTEELRKRYLNSFDERAFGGNVRDYLEKTGAIAGVGAVKVTRAWNGGLRPADMLPNEQVMAWYESQMSDEGLQPDVKSWLKTVCSAAEQKQLTTGGT
ncbi:MAG: baseplate J/gp47 family protein, partial [Firmicutes bacterium]|nr:baseplate J/gp47 family protein [Bacillota bacterium]